MMMKENEICANEKAEKFQRVLLGVILLFSYLFQYIQLVYIVALVMFISSFLGAKYTPFFQIHLKFINPESRRSTGQALACFNNPSESRFACGLALIFLIAGVILFYTGKENVAWVFILVVAALSILAGTIGFCLGAAIYVSLFGKNNKNGTQRTEYQKK